MVDCHRDNSVWGSRLVEDRLVELSLWNGLVVDSDFSDTHSRFSFARVRFARSRGFGAHFGGTFNTYFFPPSASLPHLPHSSRRVRVR
jgi:hypothetical protein